MSAHPGGELHSGAAASEAPPASESALPPLVLLDPFAPLVALALAPEFNAEDPELEPAVNFEVWLLEVPTAWVEAELSLA